jgi:hypothetical protein
MSEMTNRPTCPNTGLAQPECCCIKCVEALLRRHVPELLAEGRLEVPPSDSRREESDPPGEPPR